jgi:hypothetical protein
MLTELTDIMKLPLYLYDTESNTYLTHSVCGTNTQVSNKGMDD